MSHPDVVTDGLRQSEVDLRLARWRNDHRQVVTIARCASWLTLTVISPTYRLASWLKPADKGERSILIVKLNVIYLATALLTVSGLAVMDGNNAGALRAPGCPLWWAWAWFLWSRCAEVLIAFYQDAMDQLDGRSAASDLTAAWRIRLALNSYVELIIDYALLYALLPGLMWQTTPARLSDALWISASTITTSGNAGFAPESPLPQLLMACEIVGGVILLVVCFALYAGGAADGRNPVVAKTKVEDTPA